MASIKQITMNKLDKIIKEAENLKVDINDTDGIVITKTFLKQALLKARELRDKELIEMIEGEKIDDVTKDSISVFEDAMNYGHNTALQDVINKINEKS